ncbi:MAG: hypothetical protein LC676_19260 [Loktanella sp.]|nr:hypothetical protein [Loktanella sp.]
MAATAIRLGRELQRAAQSVSLGANSRDISFVKRSLGRLAERDPFDPRDDASFDVLQNVIETDLRAEVRGTERRFFETYYDADGQHGEMRDFPIYTERGVAIRLWCRRMAAAPTRWALPLFRASILSFTGRVNVWRMSAPFYVTEPIRGKTPILTNRAIF